MTQNPNEPTPQATEPLQPQPGTGVEPQTGPETTDPQPTDPQPVPDDGEDENA